MDKNINKYRVIVEFTRNSGSFAESYSGTLKTIVNLIMFHKK